MLPARRSARRSLLAIPSLPCAAAANSGTCRRLHSRRATDSSSSFVTARHQSLSPSTVGQPWPFWTRHDNVTAFVAALSTTYGLSSPERFYELEPKHIAAAGGQLLLKKFGNDMAAIAKYLFPSVEWLPWRFKKVPVGFWGVAANQRRYLDWLGERLGFKDREDWYQVDSAAFLNNYGGGLLSEFGNSPASAVISGYSDFSFKPWLFGRLARHYFDSVVHRREYIEWLVSKVGVGSEKELTYDHFSMNGGFALLSKFDHSPAKIIASLNIGDEREQGGVSVVDVIRSGSSPKGFFDSLEHQRAFLNELGNQVYGISQSAGGVVVDLSPWYNAKGSDIRSRGGSGLLNRYRGSMLQMLSAVYPEYKWEPWRFARTSRSLLRNEVELSRAVKELSQSLDIKHPSDWYRVSKDELTAAGAAALLRQHGGLVGVLRVVYPNEAWKEDYFG